MQRVLNYAIIDEVDSILIDEARTPLIISGPSHDASGLYMAIDQLIPSLVRQQQEDGPGDYSVDEKARPGIPLTETGQERVEQLLWQAAVLPHGQGLYDTVSISVLHHLNAALRAHVLFHRNVDYIVRDGKIVIVDEHTGRTIPGRRWSERLASGD